MGDVAIRVENLSKVYRIGLNEQRHETLFGAIAAVVKSPLSNFRNLRKLSRFDSLDEEDVIWALRDVSFEVKHAEAVGIIGRNGAGKSTLLKILSRITEPTIGRAEVFGRVASLLEVGTGFHPDLTGRENVYLNGTILGMKKREIEKKFDAIVDFAGVEKFIDTPVKRYSSGMRVRLAFSVAAHLEPEILIIDEVLAVGDAAFQQKCLGKMGEVTNRGRTVLFVSHNMGAITNLCRKAVCIDGGRVVALGPTNQVVPDYVARVNAGIPEGGFADLRNRRRPDACEERFAQFDWVRTLNVDGVQTGSFLEGEPVVIEAGLRLDKSGILVQWGAGLTVLDVYGELFMVPSKEVDSLAAGTYRVRLVVHPNWLRGGTYYTTLKLFINGQRQDTVTETISFSVISRLSQDDTSAYSSKWVHGRFRFNYSWSDPERIQDR